MGQLFEELVLLLQQGQAIDSADLSRSIDMVRASDLSRCARLFANNALRSMAGCGPASAVALPLVQDPAQASGFPTPFPPAPTAGCGQNAKIVFDGTTTLLQPGTYGDVRIFGGGRLVLAGGSQPYFFCSLRTARGARITVQHAATINILKTVNLSNATYLGPDPNVQSAISAGDIRIFVNGTSVHFSGDSDVHARLCAPNGMLRITHGSNIQGMFLARTVRTERITAGLPPGSSTTTTTSRNTTTTRLSTTTSTSHATTTTAPCTGDTRLLCGRRSRSTHGRGLSRPPVRLRARDLRQAARAGQPRPRGCP